jgi:hypothetical protein
LSKLKNSGNIQPGWLNLTRDHIALRDYRRLLSQADATTSGICYDTELAMKISVRTSANDPHENRIVVTVVVTFRGISAQAVAREDWSG